MKHYPFAGGGLSGEPFIESEVTNLYVRSTGYSAGWQIVSPATELLINYFWLHWIYLGIVWGLIIIAALTAWLGVLGVPSPAFCWVAWAILGKPRRLCRANLLGGVVPSRRRRRAASALRATRGNVPCRGRKVRRDRLAKKFASEVNKAAAALPREYPIRLSKQLKTSALTPGGRGMEKRRRVADRPRGSRRAN